jgi:hypothetical protein
MKIRPIIVNNALKTIQIINSVNRIIRGIFSIPYNRYERIFSKNWILLELLNLSQNLTNN